MKSSGLKPGRLSYADRPIFCACGNSMLQGGMVLVCECGEVELVCVECGMSALRNGEIENEPA